MIPGRNYSFRLRAKNEFGWGPYSAIATFTPQSTPSKPNAITTEIDNIYVKIEWVPPNSNGAAITRFTIQIADVSGFIWTESPNCDGNDFQTFAQNYCLVLMSELTSPTGSYKLIYNHLIQARIKAYNIAGESDYSDANLSGATAETVPLAPSQPFRGPFTTKT